MARHPGPRRRVSHRLQQARDQLRLMGRRGGGEIEVHAVLHRFGVRDGDDVDADGGGSGQTKPTGSMLVTPGPSLETPQPSASAQNRPRAETSRALKFT